MSILGEPAFERDVEGRGAEYVFVTRWYYVAEYVQSGAVVAYLVTLRRKMRLRARLPDGSGRWQRVRVQSIPFSKIDSTPVAVAGWVGAHNFGYLEAHYYGNPGGYQTFLFGIRDAGIILGPMIPYDSLFSITGRYPSPELRMSPELDAYLSDPAVVQFRGQALPNTYGVIGPTGYDLPLAGLGVDVNLVRILP